MGKYETKFKLKVVDAGVDKEERGKEGPSDHAPVWAELKLAKPSKTPAKKAVAKTIRRGQSSVGRRQD